MKRYDGDPSTWRPSTNVSAVAIGVFDGVHRGHRAVFDALHEAAAESEVVAMTFASHPDGVVRSEPAPPALTTFPEKYIS